MTPNEIISSTVDRLERLDRLAATEISFSNYKDVLHRYQVLLHDGFVLIRELAKLHAEPALNPPEHLT